MDINLSGTKELIFDIAIKQIFDNGYDNVNMRGIAEQAGIKAASIYYHFSGKREILDTIYAYYKQHFFDNFKPDDEIKNIILQGTRAEIINALTFTFEDTDQKKYQRMIMTTQIILFRLSLDKDAAEIFLRLMTEASESRVKQLLDYGIENGRISAFDTKTYATLLTGMRQVLGVRAFIRPDYTVGQLEEEKLLNAMLGDFIPIK